MARLPLAAEVRIVREALSLLQARERRQLTLLIPPVLVVAVLEVAGVASLAPFIALLSDPTSVQRHRALRWVYTTFGFTSTENLFFAVGLGIFVLLVLSNGSAAATMWALLRFSYLRNASLSTRMLRGYLQRPYPFFLERNTTDLVKKSLIEVHQVAIDVIGQAMTLMARFVAIAFLAVGLFVIDPLLAIGGILVFGGAYGSLFFYSRRSSARAGKERMLADGSRYRIAAEALGGVKEIKLYHLEESVVSRFGVAATIASNSASKNIILAQVPRYALETVAFGGVLLIVLYLLKSGGHLAGALPVIGMYAFASVRLLPAMQAVFSSLNSLRYYSSSVTALKVEADGAFLDQLPEGLGREPVAFTDRVELDAIGFSYAASPKPVLNDISLMLRRGEWSAFVGPTGSGKSTLVDILLGLLEPTTGCVRIDGVKLDATRQLSWQAHTAYVPQQIFLVDDTVEANICFGVETAQIDRPRLERAARIAQIDDFIRQEMASGYQTVVGDRGIRLSGGQRQRIGIARALYRRPDLLVLDEATSALDGATEALFFAQLKKELAQCTVVSITHRVSTTESFERVYRLENGAINGVSETANAGPPSPRAITADLKV
jgi:ABC-type multidrug transport system fused ATPase/permease subunit